MFKNLKELRKYAKQTGKQAGLWAYAAWTLPVVALFVISLEYFIGLDSWIHVSIIVGSSVFFMMSVIWWWWAVTKIAALFEMMSANAERFEDIKSELHQTKNEFQKLIDKTTKK